MKILLIDNYDSFTYNLYQLLAQFERDIKVVPNDQITLAAIKQDLPDKIVISPGPKRPEDSGVSLEVIKELYTQLPILGVCLGHQAIGLAFGSEIVHAKSVLHGKTSMISHNNQGLFAGLPSPMQVARYHSLAVKEVPADFIRTAWAEDGEVMGMQHKKYPLHSVQFHPESFLTPNGDQLIKNFLYDN